MKEIPKLAVSVFICLIAGFLGSIATISSINTWYASLTKPPWTPPNWLFGPIWTTLYILMGIAAFLVWREGFQKKEVKIALGIFSLQLILNILWSVVFFALKSTLGAFIIIIILWTTILLTMITFYRVSKPAAAILIPYITWVTIATALNYTIYTLNI
ncbi:MAG TPA: tryptophan-rich sensory protein [Methanothermobacter sp.]|jgi:tryptophan-rich sensory protein|uniref:TspO/MBR-related protein n=1 Tax=Methanothermobacter tenebrarum TaxID=680118 RepID=A0ABN6PCH2_9EURY|nr:TspO/MBR family protein [Methanothermobacter tenebrarum]MDI6882030.1 tryptophan-rich sensory protein [Methanothermobacter sp.]MDX9694001.1 TspO/MBR family protein [Methanothermobacter sp.]BDH79946.1 TspO/MBR-related protein [Methanothermobacter tenebrarum]HHW16497.1 tryptophan-rich sensory protein [Methanothermobacter sp.]HOQ20287.1 tryptophan-rich sensory protein [Methanothermobacter sp.]